MGKIAVNFFTEEIKYTLKNKTSIKSWINDTITAEGYTLGELNFIFCSDDYLLGINQQYLNHDTYTDVITFDHSEVLKIITGDVFISIDRIRENALLFKGLVADELYRVMIHGTLHLLGYKDKTKTDKALMTQKEDQHLSKLINR